MLKKWDKNVEFGESWFMRKWGRNGEMGVLVMKGGPASDGWWHGDVWCMAGGAVVVGGWALVVFGCGVWDMRRKWERFVRHRRK
jgi:hypothetical protein